MSLCKCFVRPFFEIVAVGGITAATLLEPDPAFAQDNGPTDIGSFCMQKVFGTPVANSNLLNCTANDIRVARAIAVSPDTCVAGSQIELTATFEVVVTANSRYDAGFFFRVDGGDNARGDGVNAEGTCTLSRLTSAVTPARQLDGDTCGDLNSGTYQVTFTLPSVDCVGVPDPETGLNVLKLPNCTSWHSNQATACNINSEFDFQPDTKSKCVCDDDFTVPVIVEDATITVTKTASPTDVPETGGEVTYTVIVMNNASFVSVVITDVDDDIYGDLLDPSNADVTNNDCPSLNGSVLGPGLTATCSFKAMVSGDTGDVITDTVTVCSTQPSTGTTDICDDDDASVTITDVSATPALHKTALAAGCKVDVTYEVVVSNNSTIDTLTVNSLMDNKFGNIAEVHVADPTAGIGEVVSTTCVLPTTDIAPSGNFTCQFVGRIEDSDCDFTHTDTVTGNVTDDDGVDSTPTDSATITVTKTIP